MAYKNKECEKENKRQYYLNNCEKINKTSKQYYKDHREKRLEQVKKYRKDHSEYIKQYGEKKEKFINDHKLSKGCAICGYNKCASALDFHHPHDDKKFGIGRSKHRSFNSFKKEMDKCIVICANCHRELHAKKTNEFEKM